MGIILHYLLRSMRENKFRTFIILFSVCLSSALLFASVTMTGTMKKMTIDRIQSQFGVADIQITAAKKAEDQRVRIKDIDQIGEPVVWQTGFFSTSGTVRNKENRYKRFNLQIDGVESKDLDRVLGIKLQLGNVEDFSGYSLIIGAGDAKKMKVKLGEVLTVRLKDTETKFRIVGIGESAGALRASSQNTVRVLVPLAHVQKISKAEGRLTHILVRSGNSEDNSALIRELKAVYKKEDIREIIPKEELEHAISETATSLYLMLSLVMVMGTFIIYTAFKVIAYEKLPVIGTLRSVGATKIMTDRLLFLESAVYGFVGGLSGVVLGLGILGGFSYLLSQDPFGGPPMTVTLVYGPWHLVMTVIFAVLLSLTGSAIPILNVSELPVKAVILNQVESGPEKKRTPWPAVFIITGALLSCHLVRGKAAILVDILAIAAVCVGMLKLVPWFSDISADRAHGIYQNLFGNIGAMAVRNVKGNRNIINNISLLTIGVAGVIMINTISVSVGQELLNAYKNATFDVMLFSEKIDRAYEGRVKSVEGVRSVYGFYSEDSVALEGKSYTIRSVYGVEPEYFDYWRSPLVGDRDKILSALENEKALIATTTMQRQLGLKEGDTLNLKIKNGIRSYKVVGFVRTMESNGSLVYLPARYMKTEFGKRYKDSLYIRTTGDALAVKDRIAKKFARDTVWVDTIPNISRSEMQANQQFFTVLQSFSVITLVIGVFGIFNNFLVSIMSRRRQFAIMRSVGLAKDQMVRLILAEGLFAGLIGGLCGCLGGALLCIVCGYVLEAMNIDMRLHHEMLFYVLGIAGSVALTLLACLGPAKSSSRQSIIEAVKFE